MSNSYMGPRDGDLVKYSNMKWVTEFNPDQQWASIQKEREKLIEQEREEIKNRPKDDDSFNLGGAL